MGCNDGTRLLLGCRLRCFRRRGLCNHYYPFRQSRKGRDVGCPGPEGKSEDNDCDKRAEQQERRLCMQQ